MQYGPDTVLTPAATSAGIALFDTQGKLLLVQEKKPVAAGLWHMPAGTVEPGERPEAAAVREAKEETGLEVTLTSFLEAYIGTLPDSSLIVRLVWLASALEVEKARPLFTQEIQACQFFALDEIRALYSEGRLRMHHTLLMAEDAFRVHGRGSI